MKTDDEKFDWLKYSVRFICGTILGFIIGLGIWRTFGPYSTLIGIISVSGSTVLCGLMATIWGDRFWDFFIERFWWLR